MGLSILAMADLATPMSIRVAATLGIAERAGAEGRHRGTPRRRDRDLRTGTTTPA